MRKRHDDVAMIRVRVFGTAEFEIGHRRVGMNTEVLFALGLYLTTRAGEPIPREELLQLLWGKAEDGERRHALRQLLYRLRQKGLVLEEDGDRVRLDAASVDSDLRVALDAAWIEKASTDEIDAAGEPLPNFSRRMSANFLAWLDEVRERASASHRKAALRQIAIARREGRWADLDRWARPVLRSDPLNEEATLARAESAAMAGSKTMAIEILDTYLAEVCEISPDLGKPALALRKRLSERRADWAMRGPKEVPLVGRTELMSRLTGLVDAAWRGEGGAVMLVGAPGIGKTRLAMEARAYAEMRGMRTVVVRAEAGMGEMPLASVLRLAREILANDEVIGTHPASLALLRRITAATGSQSFVELDRHVRPVSSQFADALSDAILASQAARRLVIVLEDVHCVDAASRSVIDSLVRRSKGKRIAWVLTSRQETTDQATLWPILRVQPLATANARELAETTAHAHFLALSAAALTDVVGVCAGNPLFVRELSIQSARSGDNSRLPETLEAVIGARLGTLDTASQRFLRVVLLLGAEATPRRVRMLSRESDSLFTQQIELLENDGVLAVTPSGTLTIHECWRRSLFLSLPAATASALSLECAESLLTEGEHALEASTLWKAGDLFRAAGELQTAQRLWSFAAARLYESGLLEQSSEIYSRALGVAAESGFAAELRLGLARSQLSSGAPLESLATMAALRARVINAARIQNSLLASAAAIEAEASAKLCRPHAELLASVIAHAKNDKLEPNSRLALCLTAARLASNAHLSELEKENIAIVDTLRLLKPRSLDGLLAALIYHTEHGPLEELQRLQLTIERQDFDHVGATAWCASQRILAHSLRISGEAAAAADACSRAFEQAAEAALPDDASIAAELGANIAFDQCDVRSAAEWIDRARGLSSRPSYEQRSTAMEHLLERHAVQSNQLGEPEFGLLLRVKSARSDGVPLSRLTRLSTLSYVSSLSGEIALARELAAEARAILPVVEGHSAGDYPIEMISRALHTLHLRDEAIELAGSHVRARNARFRRPFAPFYAILNHPRHL